MSRVHCGNCGVRGTLSVVCLRGERGEETERRRVCCTVNGRVVRDPSSRVSPVFMIFFVLFVVALRLRVQSSNALPSFMLHHRAGWHDH